MSPIVLIGESPGKNELKTGFPFMGDSGKMLDNALAQVPGSQEPYYLNAIQCNPGTRDEKDETLLKIATQTCRHHVLSELERAPRKVIIALGKPALWSVTDNYDYKITQERGKLLPTPLASIALIPTVHPAFIMTGGKGGTFQQFMRDIKYGLDLAAGRPPKSPPVITYEVAQGIEDILRWEQLFLHADYIASDIETSGFNHMSDDILCIGFAITSDHVYVVPKHLVKYIRPLFDNGAKFIWHNGKFDVKFLWQHGIDNARVDHDTMLLSYALDEIGGIHDLEQVSSDWLNSPNWKNMLEQYLPKPGASYANIPTPVLHKYMAFDIGNTRALLDILLPLVMADSSLRRVYHRLFIPASGFLARVEDNGIHVDLEAVQKNDGIYAAEQTKYGDELREIGAQFPASGYTEKLPGSWKQLAKLFYDDLGFKPPRRTSRSTDNDALEKLPDHPAVKALRRYRKVAKERGTYIKPLLGVHNAKGVLVKVTIIRRDGRVHASYLIHGTRTGRLASKDPNLQNVPRNPTIRGQYVAAPGRRLVEVDLNQAELRILACLSGDPELCRIYITAGMSLHDEVRAEIWGYVEKYSDSELYTQLNKFRLTPDTRFDINGKDLLIAEQKMRAKNVNFGVVYGITAAGLSDQTDSPIKDCQMWIDKWMGKFKGAAKFLQQCEEAPFKGQTLITPFGNKKRPNCVSKEKAKDISNEYKNFPEQSCASHCTLLAGIEIERQLRVQCDTKIVNLIHDALLLETPDDDDIAKEAAMLTKLKMEEVPTKWGFKRVPFIAEAKHGYRWGSLKDMHL